MKSKMAKGTPKAPSVQTVEKSSRRVAVILSKHTKGDRKAVIKAANAMLRLAEKL